VQRVKELHKAGNYLTKKQMEIICPELADSEDESIRKSLIGLVEQFMADERKEKTLAYLEKQKEQKPTPKRIFPKFAVGDTVCRPMWSDHTIREIYVGYGDSTYICVNDEGMESHIPFSKQDEWKKKEQKPDELDGKALLHVSNKYYDIGFRDGVASVKPAEWSEEDRKMLHEVVGYVTGTGCSSGITKEERSKWLWSLPKRLNLQPKNEWNEEDEHRRTDAIYFLESAKTHYADISEIDKTIAWFKSLRPQPHWKPSEEQMEALKDEIGYCYACGMHNKGRELQSLYDNLYKLI